MTPSPPNAFSGGRFLGAPVFGRGRRFIRGCPERLRSQQRNPLRPLPSSDPNLQDSRSQPRRHGKLDLLAGRANRLRYGAETGSYDNPDARQNADGLPVRFTNVDEKFLDRGTYFEAK